MAQSTRGRRGRIEVICGCMFSGKTERLLDRLASAKRRSVPAAVFKHSCDDRYSPEQIVSHSGRRTSAVPIASASRVLELAGPARLIVIDEAQFFDDELVNVCRQLAGQGRVVLVAGLDRDSWGLPFGPMERLEAIADRVTRTQAVCSVCGRAARYTQRLAPVDDVKMIGGPEAYEPRCAKCFKAPPIELRR